MISDVWAGGKTYGGCLPDASQVPPNCFPIASPMFPDAWFPPHLQDVATGTAEVSLLIWTFDEKVIRKMK
jgi:hypothetical protein